MDMPLYVNDIWYVFVWGLAPCACATILWRWLLVPSLILGLVLGLALPWTGWFDLSIGAVLRCGAGTQYGTNINATVTLLIIAHIAAWILATRWSIAALLKRNARPRSMGSFGTFVYAVLICAQTAFAAEAGGFNASAAIWISPPIWVAGANLVWAAVSYIRAHGGPSSRDSPNG